MNVSRIKSFLYKWLPIIFGCHCKDERSFHYLGKKFPICARCTGELCGICVALLSCFFFVPPIYISLLLMVPMLADGFIQLTTSYESNNIKRLITGLLFGYGLFMIFASTSLIVFKYGIQLSSRIKL